jgi:hypothetical protein
VSLTTTLTDDLICFVVFNEGPTLRTVSSINGASLAFTKTGGVSGVDPGRPTNHTSLELWTAPSTGTLTGASFTIAMSGAFDDGGVVAFALNGLHDITNPLDSNVNALKVGTGGSEVVSTTQLDDIIIAAFASSFAGNPGAAASPGFTTIANADTAGGSLFAYLNVSYKLFSTAQSGLTVTGSSGGGDLSDMVVAMTADSRGGTTGNAQTYVSVIAG